MSRKALFSAFAIILAAALLPAVAVSGGLAANATPARGISSSGGLAANVPSSVFCADSSAAGASRPDSAGLAALDAKLSEYLLALAPQTERVKAGECDFLISSCEDSLLRQRIALKAYDFYITSHLMGDEAVAIHIFDEWFASGKVKMLSDVDLMNARVFADFNRSSLLGCAAPRLTLQNMGGGLESAPRDGKVSLLFFYDTSCTKCKVETILMKQLLRGGEYAFDLFAVYTGTSRTEWEEFIKKNYGFETPLVNVHHLWDPELSSDFQRLYGVLQTPRIFLVAPDGEIIGRGLDTEALIKLLPYASMLQTLYDRCPVGERLPDVSVSARLLKGRNFRPSSESGFSSASGLSASGLSASGEPVSSLSNSSQLSPSSGSSERCTALRRAGKARIYQLRRFRGSPGYVFFYSRSCTRCRSQLSQIDSVLSEGRRSRILMVDMDALQREYPEMARDCLDHFDLTVLPKVIRVDRRGRVLSRTDSF